MKKLATLSMILFFTLLPEVQAQKIYGFAENAFCSIDLSDNSKETLITFSDGPEIGVGFRSAIDRFNGRYFFGGILPGYEGEFHIIDLVDLSIKSYSVSPGNIEYDFMMNRLIYEKNGHFYSLSLITMLETELAEIENGNSDIYGQKRTYVPQTNEYFYQDYFDATNGNPYFLVVDANSGDVICQEVIQKDNGIHYSPGGLVTNNFSGEIIGHRNGRYGIVNPCDGSMTKLLEINDYYSQLNNQMAVFNHVDKTYIIPYYSTSSSDKYKYAIVDVYGDQILDTKSQPWDGKMNLQQIYDKPIAAMVYSEDTLYVPYGGNYKWFLDNELIAETEVNYLVPTKSGMYKAEVDFKEYTTRSTEQEIFVTSISAPDMPKYFEVYPNPGSSLINLNFSHFRSGKVTIKNTFGEIVYQRMIIDCSSAQIEVSGFLNGIYIINIETENSQISTLFSKCN